MKILVINAGSSSLKYQLIDMETEVAIAKGGCERIGLDGSFCKHKANGKTATIESPMPTHKEAIQVVLHALVDKEHGAISSMDESVLTSSFAPRSSLKSVSKTLKLLP